MKRSLVMAVCALAACGKSSSTDSSGSAASAERDSPGLPNKELVATPLASVKSTAGGASFTIDLPISVLKPAEVKEEYSTWEPKRAWIDSPSFTVVLNGMPIVPDDVGGTTPIAGDPEEAAARVIARAEKLSDGGYLNLDQRKDRRFFDLQICRPVGEQKLCCSVMQRSDKPIEAFDDMLKLAETVCRSMKAKV